MPHHTTKFQIPFGALLLIVASSFALAGPLSPPAGPVSSTQKPIAEVEPRIAINATNTPGDADSLFKITQSGSYYLTGNITGLAAKNGIEIAVSNVSIDLNGFELIGVPSSLDGINIATTLDSTSIENGTIRAWGRNGISSGSSTFGLSAHRIRANGNTSNGILGSNCSTITNCTAVGNGSAGISVYLDSIITECSAGENELNGFRATSASVFTRCTSWSNSGNGFHIANGSCKAIDCIAYLNSDAGFFMASSSSICGCISNQNDVDGISAQSRCLISKNTCSGNGTGAGIRVSGTDTRIEENNCVSAEVGIRVTSSSCFIIKNTCGGNTTNWDIAANNFYGAIIDRTTATTAAVSSNAATSTLGSTDSNANFSY